MLYIFFPSHLASWRWKKSPFCAYVSTLNSQHRLFIYLPPLSLFVPANSPQHNLTTWKKSVKRLPSPPPPNLYFYTCLLSHLMKQNMYGLEENVCCVWWKCLNHFILFPFHSSPCFVVERRILLMSLDREIVWRNTKKKKKEQLGSERDRGEKKRIHYTNSCDI